MVGNQLILIPRSFAAAYQTTPVPAAQPGWMQLVPMLAIFAIFYFLLIAPSRKRQKKTQEMLKALKKGDEVVTSGGLYGTVAAVDDRVVHLKISDQVKVKVERSAVTALISNSGISNE